MKIARLLSFGLLFAASLACIQAETSARTIRLRSDAWMPFCGNPTASRRCHRQLDSVELDVIAESQPVWVWTIKKSGRVNKDYRTAFKKFGKPIYIAFSSKAPAECPMIFAEGLRELRANGKLAEILARY